MLRLRSLSLLLIGLCYVAVLAFEGPGLAPSAQAQDDDHDDGDDESPKAAPAAAAKTLSAEDEARRKQVIVRAKGVQITVGQVEDHITSQSPLLRGRYNNPDELKKLVDNMVRFELLAQEAEQRGYDKNPAVVRTVKDSTVQNLIRADVDEKVTPQSIPAEAVKAYYEGHESEFHRAAMRRASHILLDTEKEAKELIAQAKAHDMRGFAELAKKQSKDIETKLRGGDLGYFGAEPIEGRTESKVHEALRKAAFALKNIGDTTAKPIAVDDHFSVLRLTGERPEQHTTLAEAEPSIRTRLWRERRQQALTGLVEGLRAKEEPVVKADLVDLVKLEDMDRGPAGFSPDRKNPHQARKQGGH